jgi:hypothetical protein
VQPFSSKTVSLLLNATPNFGSNSPFILVISSIVQT